MNFKSIAICPNYTSNNLFGYNYSNLFPGKVSDREKYLDQTTVVLLISRENKFYLRFLIKYLSWTWYCKSWSSARQLITTKHVALTETLSTQPSQFNTVPTGSHHALTLSNVFLCCRNAHQPNGKGKFFSFPH